MTSLLQLLDCSPRTPEKNSDWGKELEASILRSPEEWLRAVRLGGGLSDARAWALLSWIETLASEVARTGSQEKIGLAASAMSLVCLSELDRRDLSLVASLLRRAAALSEAEYMSAVMEGCSRMGESGSEAEALLLNASASTPATHIESGSGQTFRFVRRPSEFDVQDLERWLEGEGDRSN
jgi:hypothetical protein